MSYVGGPVARPVDVHVTGRRIVASLLDGLFMSVLAGVITGPVAAVGHANVDQFWSSGSLRAAYLALAGLYYIVAEGFFGRTPGKLITGIRVIREDTGGTPGLGAAFLRTLLRLVDGIGGYLLGFIVVLSSSRRRRLGDMVARTLVIRG